MYIGTFVLFSNKKYPIIEEFEPKLQFVRIFLDSPTFDRIKKDKKAKMVDILSAIGGTMGLLTGFSIISGVEIIFYLYKFVRYLTSKFSYIFYSNSKHS